MDRRHFLLTAGSASLALASELRASEPAPAPRLLFLIDLVGGNDALNTLAPHTDPAYYRARPTIALDRRTVLPIAPGQALHPSLRPLMPMWEAGELEMEEIQQGVQERYAVLEAEGKLDDPGEEDSALTDLFAEMDRVYRALSPLEPGSDLHGHVWTLIRIPPRDGVARR